MSVLGHVAVNALDAKESSLGTLNKYDSREVGSGDGGSDLEARKTENENDAFGSGESGSDPEARKTENENGAFGSGEGGSDPEARKTENENDALTKFGWVGIPGDTYHVGETASVHLDLRPPPLVVSGAGY